MINPIYDSAELSTLFEVLESAKTILIFGHKSPDGDSIGSTLAFHHYLAAKGIKSQVIHPDGFPNFLSWMKGTDAIISLINEEELPAVTSDDYSEGFSISPIYGFLVIIAFMIIKAFVKNKVVKVIIGVVLGIIIGFVFSSVIAGLVGTGVSIVALLAVFGGGGSGGGGYYGGGSSYGGGYSGGGFGGGFSGGGGSFGGGGASGGW